MLATTGALAGLLLGFGAPAQAASPNPDQSLSALRSYAQQLDTAPAASLKGAVQVAEARSLLDALRRSSNHTDSAMGANAKADKPVSHGPMREAKYVGSKVCLGCHTSQAHLFERTLMGRLQKQGKMQCESCHGPGSEHVRLGGGRGVGGIISFRANDHSRTPAENNAICLGCHEKGARTLWNGSIHQSRGLACTNCHTIMKDVSRKYQLKTAQQPDTCFQCHKDIRAKVMRSEHMPVREGKMACSDCHSPHGSYNDHLLKEATVNDVCFQCHADKRGPFLWEHPPVVENCLNCHDPHGAINDNMLQVSRPRLCQRCHNVASRHPANPRNPVEIRAVGAGCLNCHSQIHGSNSPGGKAFLR